MVRVLCLASAIAMSCTSGAPPGFSGGRGDRWSMPLVGPLEDGLLITAVTVNTHGPYLFAIDPDAEITVVDGELVKAAELRTFNGPHRLDETDTQQPRIYAELIGLEIGTLIVERRDAIVVRSGSYDSGGRRIHGVIGRDVLADSVVFGFDREQGLAHLVAQKSFQIPTGAGVLKYTELPSRVPNAQVLPVPRRIYSAAVNGTKLAMHLDLGAPASQLRASKWDEAKLVARDVKIALIDEIGTVRVVDKASEPARVVAGGAWSERVVFLPYGDERWETQDIDGTLGLNFFANYNVWHSWHTREYFYVSRTPVPVAQRIARWDSAVLQRCKNPGCVAIRVVDPLNGAPPPEGKPHPGLVLSVARDEIAGGMGLEVVLEANARPELPRLIVNLPANADRLIHQLKPDLLGTTLSVVDASPFPRSCPGPNGCVDRIAR